MTIELKTTPDSMAVHIVFSPQNAIDKVLNNLLCERFRNCLADDTAVSVSGSDVLTLTLEGSE